MMRVYSRPRDEDGSIIVAMMVIFVATALIVSVVALVYSSMRTTRRYGDSANALQLADAAVNDAVKDIPTVAGQNMPLKTKVLGTAGSYSYSATLDPAASIWHIDAFGIDNSGVKRHVKAEASPESLFSNAFFVDSALALPSGVLMDSFTSGLTPESMCTRKGILGTNNPGNLTFNSSGGSGTAQKNCTDAVYFSSNSVWPYPVDGCVGYHDPSAPDVYPPNYGQPNQCPPAPYTTVSTPKYSIPSVAVPNGTNFVTQSSSAGNGAQSWPAVPCDATHHIPGGARYYVSQVNLLPGCRVDAANGPALIYTTGSVNIGIQNGAGSTNQTPGMNQPDTSPSNSLICTNPGTTDTHSNPGSYYCPGWSANLQIYMTDGNTNSINFGNHADFWGVIMGQNAQIATAPHVEMWGALRVGGLAGSSQLSLHYDEALGSISTGVYSIKSWREEPN
jgi:hypothetical protein